MDDRLNLLRRRAFLISLCCLVAANIYGQGNGESKRPFVFLVPVGYEYMHLDRQTVHSFAVGAEHKLGDFAGIGAGIKHDMKSFVLFHNAAVFELQQTSVFGTIDISILKIQGGWIFNSDYLIDGEKRGSPGKGFFVSAQGIIPIKIKR